jgi:uncharacterized lipoprotein YmbA
MKTPIEVPDMNPNRKNMVTCPLNKTAADNPAGSALLARLLCLSMPVRLLLALVLAVSLTGCFGFLKPAKPTARHFVLNSLPAVEPPATPSGAVAVGIGPVKCAAYLFNTSLAVRKGTNEIDYLPATFWAERLDTGLQRVLAANLATLLPTDQIRLSAWQNADVAAEVYVAVEQFDVDAQGKGALVAWWRVLSPGGEKTLKAGECRLVRQGPLPDANPSGAVATLSELVADLSRQLAQALKETPLAAPNNPSHPGAARSSN